MDQPPFEIWCANIAPKLKNKVFLKLTKLRKNIKSRSNIHLTINSIYIKNVLFLKATLAKEITEPLCKIPMKILICEKMCCIYGCMVISNLSISLAS